jgi:hypothetical protein
MKFVLFIFILFSRAALATEWVEKDCGQYNAYNGEVFFLKISTAFHGEVSFKLCKSKVQNVLNVRVINHGASKEIATELNYTFPLFEQEYIQIIGFYQKAMSYNALDRISGTDGSSWCLEGMQGINYRKACFWSPGLGSEERGIGGLYKLGAYLWEFSGLDKNAALRLY